MDNANLSEIELTIGVIRTNTFILPIKPDHLSGYVQRLQAFLLQLRFVLKLTLPLGNSVDYGTLNQNQPFHPYGPAIHTKKLIF